MSGSSFTCQEVDEPEIVKWMNAVGCHGSVSFALTASLAVEYCGRSRNEDPLIYFLLCLVLFASMASVWSKKQIQEILRFKKKKTLDNMTPLTVGLLNQFQRFY